MTAGTSVREAAPSRRTDRRDRAALTTRRLRILEVIGHFDAAGAETVVLHLANDLARAGHDVFVTSRVPGALAASLENVGYVVIPKSGTLDLGYLWRLCRLIRRLKIDVVHSHLFGNNVYAFVAAKLTGRRIIITLHGFESFRSRKRILAYRLMAARADRVVVVSRALQDAFERLVGRAGAHLALVPNGIDLRRFREAIAGDDLRAELGLDPAAPVVGAVGNIKPVKGYDVLVEAWRQVAAVRPDARLLVVGAPSDGGENRTFKERLDRRVAELGLKGSVRFLGSRSDVHRLLRTFTVYTIPSRSEGMSLALLEAMASGRAVVATAVGGNPHLIQDGVTGLLVPPEDPDALAASILTLFGDAARREALGRQATASVERFAVAAMTEAYLRIYQVGEPCDLGPVAPTPGGGH